MAQKLSDLFEKKRQEALKEDFQIGQAAQALQELKRAAAEFSNFLDKDFTQAFKNLHNDPRNIEEGIYPLMEALEKQQARLAAVVEEMDSYLSDVSTSLNPQSVNHGHHHKDRMKNRWARWEHQPKRDRNAVDEE